MLDFDRFSEINDSHGREVGDAVLRRGASVLRSVAASPRLVFRYGGEEFVVLAGATEGDARGLAEQVRTEMALQNGSLPSVTVSCGVAQLEEPFEPWVALDRADAALRDAKRSGRNRVMVAGHTSPGERIMLVEELERETAQRVALAVAVATLQVRDAGTADHSADVVTLCEAVGRRLDFDEHELRYLTAGAQLHDVGKVAMPSSILNKPAALTPDEWEVIREHTIIGERILRSVPEMSEVAAIVRHSHEHWDGSGYPDGLAGTEIPRASRVILCADAFHAIRSDRPYRKGRPVGAAIVELEACRGTQFEPAVVDALVAVAADAKRNPAAAAVGPRNKRLVALLTALVIGGGSAVAAIPEVRDAMRSVFGASTGPSETIPGSSVQGLGLGPLGDLLSLPVAGQHHKQQTAEPRGRERGGTPNPGDAGLRLAPALDGQQVGFGAPHSGGGQPEAGRLQPTPTGSVPAPTPTPNSGTGPAPGANTDSTMPAGPDQSSSGGETRATPEPNSSRPGRGLGRDVPTPRNPAQPPPQSGGRTDAPALGHANPPQPNGQAEGHSK